MGFWLPHSHSLPCIHTRHLGTVVSPALPLPCHGTGCCCCGCCCCFCYDALLLLLLPPEVLPQHIQALGKVGPAQAQPEVTRRGTWCVVIYTGRQQQDATALDQPVTKLLNIFARFDPVAMERDKARFGPKQGMDGKPESELQITSGRKSNNANITTGIMA